MVEIAETYLGRWNRRYVMRLQDGSQVESVVYRDDALCVSSQVGCAVGCPFCASGANGLGRNLTLEELQGQVEAVRNEVPTLRRITISGVGEPLHNPHHVADFADWCHKEQLPVSITTSGGPLRRLKEWLHRSHNGITLSVHAGFEATRKKTVPKGPPLGELFDCLQNELPQLSGQKKRKLALAYLLLREQNDSEAEVDAFIKRVEELGIKVHLYAYNPVPTSDAQRADEARYDFFYQRMRQAGLDVRRSSQARIEANGGCGTLVALKAKRERKPQTNSHHSL